MSSPQNPNLPATNSLPGFEKEPPKRKSEGIAFVLSLFLPGAGTVYCGKKKRGYWTMGLTIGSVVAAYLLANSISDDVHQAAGDETMLAIFLQTSFVLFGFSLFDALATVREVSSGQDRTMRYNPRVAATLNLITRGFGYFYVGERRTGGLVFAAMFLLGMASFAVKESSAKVLLSIMSIGVSAYFGADVYATARKKNPPVPRLGPTSGQGRNRWDYAVWGVVSTMAVVVILLFIAGAYLGSFTVDQRHAILEITRDEATYENRDFGVKMKLPGTWVKVESGPGDFVILRSADNTMGVALAAIPILPMTPADLVEPDLKSGFTKRGFVMSTEYPHTEKGRVMQKLVFCRGDLGNPCKETETAWFWKKGLIVYVLRFGEGHTEDPTQYRLQQILNETLNQDVTTE